MPLPKLSCRSERAVLCLVSFVLNDHLYEAASKIAHDASAAIVVDSEGVCREDVRRR